MLSIRICALGLSFLAAGCTLLELDTLVPSAAVSDVNSLKEMQIKICTPSKAASPEDVAKRHDARLLALQTNASTVQNALPAALRNDAVVNAALQHAKYVSTNSLVTARYLINGSLSEQDAALMAASSKPNRISTSDLLTFAYSVASHALRNTAPPEGANDSANQFWNHLKAYYTDYYKGEFVSYFAQTIDKPKVSLTIDDTEIVQTASVFLELLFDEVLQPTVWQDADNKYYPGGITNKLPLSYLKAHPSALKKIDKSINGCGMNVPKANTLTYLANTFATAASAESSLTIKSVGGLEVGLGIVGKLNVGDNNTLTALLQAVVTEAVKRLTVAIAAPILEAIDLESPSAAQISSLYSQRIDLGGNVTPAQTRLFIARRPSQAELTRRYSAPFVSLR